MITKTETYNDMVSGKKLTKETTFYENGNILREFYQLNNELHREDGSAAIWYYEDSNIEAESYCLNNKRHREDGPALICYDEDGSIETKKYYLNNFEIEDPLQLLVLETLKGENDMRWKKKAKVKDGETRTVSKFLILPKTIKGETRWLENASWIEKWCWVGGQEDGYEWEVVDWLENCVMDKLTE